ncbi:MAG: SRPBCC family protein, partial [Acidimicrobiia bacterium]
MALPIEIHVLIAAPPARVWAELADFASHPQWMDDAATVRFLSDRTTGIGTRIEAATMVGPLRATDVMEVVRWEVGKTIVVEHVGAVKGFGRFDIGPMGEGTEMRWVEDLRFPWWMGGP